MPKKPSIKVQDIINSPLFAGVPPKFLKNVPKYCTVQEVAQGTTIIKEGDKGDSMFIVIQGQVDVFKGPKMVKLATLGSGVFVGEGALVSGAPRNATVVAASPVKLAYFDKAGFDKLVIIHSAIPLTLMKTHNERCKDTVRKVNSAKSKSFIAIVAVGVIMLLKNSPSLLPIPELQPLLEQITGLIPDQFMALAGPSAIVGFLKLQKLDMGDLVSKLDKI